MPHISSSPRSNHLGSQDESCIMPLPSPLSAAAAKLRPAPPKYREAKTLPFELKEQVRVYLEEALHLQALNLLIRFLTIGLSSEDLPANRPAHIPPPSHLALISSLAVHPSFTTRTSNTDKLQASSLAIQYLKLLTETIGPIRADFSKAYTFPAVEDISRRGTVPRRRDASPNKPIAFNDEIMSDLAGEQSLWVRAGDFWNIVGWAMNCSVAHRKRWDRWHLWLEHVVEVLERDWEVQRFDDKVEDSLLVSFVKGRDVRRILRAVFANGTTEGAEFTEIWRNETKERKEKDLEFGEKKIKVDVENGEFGDYFNDSDESEEDDARCRRKIKAEPDADESEEDTIMVDSSSVAQIPSGSEPLGGPSALSIRMRLLGLLSSLALSWPSLLVGLRDFSAELQSHIRPFPLLTFATVISPPSLDLLELHVASYIVQFVAISLLESSAPLPQTDDLTQEILEQSFLPWAANTSAVADNAKLGACVETLVRLLDKAVGLKWSEGLARGIEKGVKRREEKAKTVRKRKGEAGTGSSEIDAAWLKASGSRIRLLVEIAKEDMDGSD